jgi:F-type H+-transporting ATPase subunit b
MDVLGNFGINWAALIEYAVNFLLLTIILTVFAYKPVITMLEKRRKMIAKAAEDAKDVEEQKKRSEVDYKDILAKANNESKQIVQNAVAQSAVIAQNIQNEAKAQAEATIKKATEEIEAQKHQMYTSIKTDIGNLLEQTLRKVLGESLTEDEQKKILHKAIDEINK